MPFLRQVVMNRLVLGTPLGTCGAGAGLKKYLQVESPSIRITGNVVARPAGLQTQSQSEQGGKVRSLSCRTLTLGARGWVDESPDGPARALGDLWATREPLAQHPTGPHHPLL